MITSLIRSTFPDLTKDAMPVDIDAVVFWKVLTERTQRSMSHADRRREISGSWTRLTKKQSVSHLKQEAEFFISRNMRGVCPSSVELAPDRIGQRVSTR